MNNKKSTRAERKQSISDVNFKGTKERRNLACSRYIKRLLWLEHSWGDGAMVEDQVSDQNKGKEFLLTCIGSQRMVLKREKAWSTFSFSNITLVTKWRMACMEARMD